CKARKRRFPGPLGGRKIGAGPQARRGPCGWERGEDMRRCVGWGAVLLVVGLVGAADGGRAGEGGEPDRKGVGKMLQATPRGVLNRGADLYNSGDISGSYRLFEGALMAVKPMLKHRPELQKAIESGVAGAERDPAMWRRAFALRGVLVKIRREVGGKA